MHQLKCAGKHRRCFHCDANHDYAHHYGHVYDRVYEHLIRFQYHESVSSCLYERATLPFYVCASFLCARVYGLNVIHAFHGHDYDHVYAPYDHDLCIYVLYDYALYAYVPHVCVLYVQLISEGHDHVSTHDYANHENKGVLPR